jgi:hypothetical protein
MMAVLPTTSVDCVDCERGFSSLNRIKNDLRNHLENPHLARLIRISETNMDALAFYEDNSESFVASWLHSKKRRETGKRDLARV